MPITFQKLSASLKLCSSIVTYMKFQKLLPNPSPITHFIWWRCPFQTKFYLPPHRFPFALQLSFLSLNILFQSQFSLSFVTSITDFTLVAFYTADFIWLHISIGDVSSTATSIEHIISFATFKYEFVFICFSVATYTVNYTSVPTSMRDLLGTPITDFIPFVTTMVHCKIKFGWNLHHRFHLCGICIADFIHLPLPCFKFWFHCWFLFVWNFHCTC